MVRQQRSPSEAQGSLAAHDVTYSTLFVTLLPATSCHRLVTVRHATAELHHKVLFIDVGL